MAHPETPEKFLEIVKILDKDVLSTKEFTQLIGRVVVVFKDAKRYLKEQADDHRKGMDKALDSCMKDLLGRLETFQEDVDEAFGNERKDIDKKIAKLTKDVSVSLDKIKALIPEETDLSGIEKSLENIEKQQEPEFIKTKLESLEGDARLDKSAIKGLDEEVARLDKRIDEKSSGTGVGIKQLMAVPFSFSGDGATTQFYLPTEPLGKGWFLFAHYQGQWLQKEIHFALNRKIFDTSAGSSPFTPEDGTVIEGFLIY